MSAEQLKELAARAAVASIDAGMRVGLGTGSTASHAVRALGERVAAGLTIVGVPTSEATAALARSLNVPLTELDAVEALDVTIDGADEVDLDTFAVIKGFGGALLREKLVALATIRQIIIVDESKVAADGLTKQVPVEVVPFGAAHTVRALERLGAKPTLRLRDGAPFVTDGGNWIFDCDFGPLADPAGLAAAIKAISGVVDHGLFIGIVETVLVAGAGGVRTYRRE
ncbi:MAG TPA: ribose-5-phosphate isomerase RpiA [Thermomicrobiales bacterium]